MGIINCKEGFNIEGEDREEINIDEQLNSKYKFEDLCDEKKFDKNEKNGKFGDYNSENMFEILKCELESEIEKTNYEILYRIIDENVKKI